MKGKRCFVDSNLIVYLYSTDDKQKREILISKWDGQHQLSISRQVVNETCSVLLKKFAISTKDVERVVYELENAFSIVELTEVTTKETLRIKEEYKYSFWDSMIIASALENDCQVLYSEDMKNGQVIEQKLKIENPIE